MRKPHAHPGELHRRLHGTAPHVGSGASGGKRRVRRQIQAVTAELLLLLLLLLLLEVVAGTQLGARVALARRRGVAWAACAVSARSHRLQ